MSFSEYLEKKKKQDGYTEGKGSSPFLQWMNQKEQKEREEERRKVFAQTHPSSYEIKVDDPTLRPRAESDFSTYLTGLNNSDSYSTYPAIMQSETGRKMVEEKNKAAEEKRKKEKEDRENQYGFGPIGYQVKNNNPNTNSGQFLTHGEPIIPEYDYIKYADIPQLPDYNEAVARSKEMPKESVNPFAQKEPWNQINYYNELQKASGKSDEDILKLTKLHDVSYDNDSFSWMRRNALMNDQERDIYNYMFGKYGADAAAKYMNSIQNSLSQKGAAAQYVANKEFPGALQVPHNMMESFNGGVNDAFEGFATLPDFALGRAGDYKPKEHEYLQQMQIDNAPWAEGMAYKLSSGIGNMVPSLVAGALTGGIGAGGAAAEGASTIGGRLAAWAATGAAQEGIFATQIAGQQYRQDIMDGRPVEGAQLNAMLTAADEAITNWLLGGISAFGGGTIKKLLGDTKVAKAAKQGISSALAKSPGARRTVMGAMDYGADMLSEGTQEAVQDFTQAIREHFIYGDELDLKGVATDPQTWEDFALGALTAGTMNAPGAIANNLAVNNYGKSIDQDYREYAEGIDTRRESYKTDADYQRAVSLQSLAQEYAERQANKEFIPNRDKAEYEMDFAKFHDDLRAGDIKDYMNQGMTEDEAYQRAYNDFLGKEYETGNQAEEESPHYTAQEPESRYNQPESPQARENTSAEPKADNVAQNEPEDIKVAVDMWAEPYGKAGQKAFKEIYDGETDLKTYYQSFGRAYNIGRYNMQPTAKQQAEAAVILGVDGFSEVYKAGVHDRPEIEYDRKTGSLNGMVKGKQKEGGLGIVAQSTTDAQKKIATHIGKLTGLQINLVDSLENQNAAASYSKGKITLSVNSNDFLGSASHELTHYIKDYAPDAYQVYVDHAVRAITEAQGVDLETMINDYSTAYERQTGQQLSRDEAIDEIVSDATQKFLNDPDYISRAIKEDSTIGQRIIDFLTDVIDAIKEMAKTASTRRAAKALEENLKYYEQCRQEWMVGLEEAGARYKAGWENDTDTKYQLNQFGLEEYTEKARERWKESNIMFANTKQDIIDYFNTKVHKKPYSRLYIGAIGSELADRIYKDTNINLEGYNLAITSEFENSHADADKEKPRGQIAVTAEMVADLPEIISKYDKVIVTDKQANGKPVLKFEKNINGKRVAIEYVSDKRKMLTLQTMYAWGDKNNNRNVPTAPDVRASAQTSETRSGIVPVKDSITQDSNESKTRFQLKDPIEETKDLIAVHNLSEDKLLGNFKLGGIPMPSIAVTKADIGHSNFGDISLVFTKDTIDPKNRKNKVYGADAWTPTFPRIEYEADEKAARKVTDIINKLDEKLPDEYSRRANAFVSGLESNLNNYGGESGVVERALKDYGMKAAYLASQGETVEVKIRKTKEKIPDDRQTLYKSLLDEFGAEADQMKGSGREIYEKFGDRIKAAYIKGLMELGESEDAAWDIADKKKKYGIVAEMRNALKYRDTGATITTEAPDYAGAEKSMDSQIDEGKYKDWLNGLFAGVEKSQGIHNGKDYLTPSGNRRSFKQLHYEVTAENVVKSMLSQSDDVKNVAGWQGVKSVRAKVTDDFKSIDQIKKKSDRLKDVDTESYNTMLERMENRLYATMRQIADNSTSKSDNSFMNIDAMGECLLEAYKNPTAENIKSVLGKYGWTVTAGQAQELATIAEDVYNMPVNMYEAKPQRVVGFDEIAAAVIPTTASEELKTQLDANGIHTVAYDPNLPDARKEAVNDLKDVRFQLEDVDADEDQVRVLQHENKSLREANELLKKEFELTGKTEPRLSDVKKVSTDFLRKYNSGYNHTTLTNNLSKFYDYIRSSDQVDMGTVNDLATGIARSILKNSKSESEFAEQYQDLKKQIKATKIKITDQDKADLAQMGGYNEFRKQYFGKLKLGNDGISIDSFYQELSDQNPEMFDRGITHPADQLIAVASAIDTMTDQIANPYGADIDEMSYIVGQEILQAYTKVQEVPATFADKKAVELQQVKRQYNQKLTDYKNEIKKKYDQTLYQVRKENIAKIGELAKEYRNLNKEYRNLNDARMVDKADYRVKMDRLRNDKNQAMAAMQQRHREQLQQRRDSLRAREAKKGIIKQVRELDRWLLEPNDKKHVPESLRTVTAQFLQSIDFSSDWTDKNGNPAQRTVLWNDLSRKLDGILKNGGVSNEEGEQRILDIDPSLPEKINALAEKVKDIDRLEDMKADDLERLHESVIAMKKLIQDANQMISNANYRTVENAAVSFLSETDSKKTGIAFTEKSAVGKVDKLFNEDMLTPYTIFWRMGPVMRSIHKELAAGEDRHTRNMAAMVEYFQDTCKELGVTKKEFKSWTGAKAEQKTFVISGKEIKLTTAQIMELYELNKRNQGRLHIYQGGIVPSDRIKQDEGKIKKIASSALGVITPRQSPVKVAESDVRRITSTLTPKQIDLADRLQHFLEYTAADWGNETSMRQYGYKKFRPGTHYYPVQSYDNAIRRNASEVGMDALSSIKNIGAAKATTKDARNALVVNDIFDTFIRHSNQMSMYNAMLCPLTDFQKVYNYKSEDAGNVKEEMERIWGKNNSKYLDKLIKDINGKVENPDQGLNALWMKNMKAASVALNLRVAIQQPTAMTRALSVLSLGDMASGTLMKSPTLNSKEQWETMCKYAPITQWKEWGFYKMDASRSMREILLGSDSIKDTVVNKSMFLAEKGDEWAWKRMWNACEYETINKHPEIKKGSEEYYQTVGKRFSEVIDATQVVDSVLHRTQIARNPDGLVKISAAFMNEPLQSYNMLYRAAIEARETGNIKKAFPVMATAGAIYVANALTTAALASIIDAVRDDDKDKNFIEKYLTALGENSLDNLNPMNMVPVLKDVVSIFQGFTAKRADLSGIEDMARAAKEWVRYFDGESGYTKSYLTMKTLDSLSNITGVPIKSLNRDIIKPLVRGMYNLSGSGEYGLTKRDYDIGSKKNIGRYTELIIDAMLDGDEKKAERIKSDMLAAGIAEDDISSKYDSEYKEYLIENVPEITEAAQARLDGKPEEYKRINDELVGAGYEQAYIKKAVDSTLNKLKKETGVAEAEGTEDQEESEAAEETPKAESIYSSYDLLSSIEQFDSTIQSLKSFNTVAEDMYQAKRSNGKTKIDAIGEIKSTITKAYKGQWIDAYRRKDRETYEAIQNKLKHLKIDGVIIYDSKDWGNWVDAARKKS